MTLIEVVLAMMVLALGYWVVDLSARMSAQSQRLNHDTSRIDNICIYLTKQAEQRQQTEEGEEWKRGVTDDEDDLP